MLNTKPLNMILDSKPEQRVVVLRVLDGAWGDRQVLVMSANGNRATVHETRLSLIWESWIR